jgi:protocatechuate 3,4-dioxygenase beta subunit
VIIPVCLYLSTGILLTISASNGNLKLLTQDCNGVPISISGKVQRTNNEPIDDAAVFVNYVAMDRSEKFSFTIVTDKDGRFSYKKSLSIFVCEYLSFDVSAKGFKNKHIQYSLFHDHREAEISTITVNAINITITLERSS